jgi:ABC-type dipeptide/oligopeptide/nickel transport system permease subunit
MARGEEGPIHSLRAAAGAAFRELAITALLLALLIVLLTVCESRQHPLQPDFAAHFWRFATTLSLDEHGRPLGEPLWAATLKSLQLGGLTLALLCLAGVAAGTAFVRLSSGPVLRMIVLTVSAAPSFVLPFVPFFFFPDTFRGFFSDTWLIWPALALAVGDLNLLYVSDLFAESLRHELAQPHVRTLRLFTRHPGWHLWPRTGLVLVQVLAARVPHLLGGTIALERMYNIHGLGFKTLSALFDETPDYHIVFWVCAVGIVLRLVFRLCYLALAGFYHVPADLSVTGTPLAAGTADAVESDAEVQRPAARAQASAGNALPDLPVLLPQSGGPPSFAATCWRRLTYYRHYSVWHAVEMAVTLAAFSVALAGGVWLATLPGPKEQTKLRDLPPNLSREEWVQLLADPQHGARYGEELQGQPLPVFGTDSVGYEVASVMAGGLRQQALPLMAAVALGLACGGGAGLLFGVRPSLLAGPWRIGAQRLGQLTMHLILEFFEALPKLVILLLIYASLGWTGLILKMYVVIGLIFAPQVYRALQADLSSLSRSLFLESAETAGVSRWSIWMHNVFRNHSLHVLAVQGAILLGCILHVDALLGYVGIRQKNVLFNWGSVLGSNLDEFNRMVPTEAVIRKTSDQAIEAVLSFNQSAAWLPALGVWLLIFIAFLLAQFIKIPLSGYVYRLK